MGMNQMGGANPRPNMMVFTISYNFIYRVECRINLDLKWA